MEKLLEPHFGLMFWTILNFFLLVFLLGKFAWKPMLKAINDRENKISSDISSAEKNRQESEKLKVEMDEGLKKIKKESDRLIKEAKELGEKHKEEILATAKQESHRIIQDAKGDIEVEKQNAIKQIQSEISQIVILASQKLLGKNIDSADNKKFTDKVISELKNK